MKRYEAHRKYELKSGELVVGVSTVLQILAKPALIPWANKLGLDNIDVRKYVDELADIGTLSHYFVECENKDKMRDPERLAGYTATHHKAAEICFKKFLDWKKEVDFQPLKSELRLVSETHRYGGTLDLYGYRHKKKTLIDFKTGSGLYPEHFTQMSAYRNLLIENGLEVAECRIIRIGRTENEGFEDRYVPNTKVHFRRFLACLEIYRLNKELGVK